MKFFSLKLARTIALDVSLMGTIKFVWHANSQHFYLKINALNHVHIILRMLAIGVSIKPMMKINLRSMHLPVSSFQIIWSLILLMGITHSN